MEQQWRACSSCKKPILLNSKYFKCSVSTCNGERTGYVFCSIHCFERHLPGAKHRDAGAIECISPKIMPTASQTTPNPNPPPTPTSSPTSTILRNQSGQVSQIKTHSQNPQQNAMSPSDEDVLIVVSKLKNYIREKSEMNTSGDVADILSDIVRACCDEAIINARQDGRKTVMARDFSKKRAF